jgi:flavin-binding protein dodecin
MSSVARVTEIIASSKKSFEDAVEKGIDRACKTLNEVKGAWVKDQKVAIEDGKVKRYRVTLMVTFVLDTLTPALPRPDRSITSEGEARRCFMVGISVMPPDISLPSFLDLISLTASASF